MNTQYKWSILDWSDEYSFSPYAGCPNLREHIENT